MEGNVVDMEIIRHHRNFAAVLAGASSVAAFADPIWLYPAGALAFSAAVAAIILKARS